MIFIVVTSAWLILGLIIAWIDQQTRPDADWFDFTVAILFAPVVYCFAWRNLSPKND